MPLNVGPRRNGEWKFACSEYLTRTALVVPVQPKRESERSAVVKTPPCGQGFSRHRGLSIRWGGA